MSRSLVDERTARAVRSTEPTQDEATAAGSTTQTPIAPLISP